MEKLRIFNPEQEKSVLLVNIKEANSVLSPLARNKTFIAKDYGHFTPSTFANTYLHSFGRVRNEVLVDIDHHTGTAIAAKVVGRFRLKQWKEGYPKTQ